MHVCKPGVALAQVIGRASTAAEIDEMANRPARFTQSDITRALKGVAAAGFEAAEVFATEQGVRVIIVRPGENTRTNAGNSSWDRVLDNDHEN